MIRKISVAASVVALAALAACGRGDDMNADSIGATSGAMATPPATTFPTTGTTTGMTTGATTGVDTSLTRRP